MKGGQTFEYGGLHFTPVRRFRKAEGDFFAISRRLAADPELGICTYPERQKASYDYKGFYEASTDKECDIFRCEENGRLYVPGESEIFICHEPGQREKASVTAALSQKKDTPEMPRDSGSRRNSGPER